MIGAFRDDVPVLLSTESAGEGRNLQFCHVMINLDLPWNPMQIEQRLGRLHRVGQSHDVVLTNLVSKGSIEERILHVLESKINMFELVVGELDMILGRVDDEFDFETSVFDAFATRRGRRRVRQRLERAGRAAGQCPYVTIVESRAAVDALVGGDGAERASDPKDTPLRLLARLVARSADGLWETPGTPSSRSCPPPGERPGTARRDAVTADPDVAREDGAMLLVTGHPAVAKAAEASWRRATPARSPWPLPRSAPPDAATLLTKPETVLPVEHGSDPPDAALERALRPFCASGALVGCALTAEDQLPGAGRACGSTCPAALRCSTGSSGASPDRP